MLKTRLTELLGIKHPIIQAGMGPFSNNNLCVAAANAGILGLLSTSGLFHKEYEPWIYKAFVESGEASMDDDIAQVLEKILKRTYRLTKDQRRRLRDQRDGVGRGARHVENSARYGDPRP